ncbi:hypothetical protein K0504_09570 [Neiella marina]|uniref:Uncharacterized protein n=1 Tax=Neiella holothuriorum TaxID=2870530 RepID=A0ABS7EG16_9GAMM|nr:hypothetical protein [Neiella holothuriorum]MBW8191284.1 hypothetical protein [Neiella holothuriorum]
MLEPSVNFPPEDQGFQFLVPMFLLAASVFACAFIRWLLVEDSLREETRIEQDLARVTKELEINAKKLAEFKL